MKINLFSNKYGRSPFLIIRNWISQKWYYFKCRLWHRYNVVYVKTLQPTWNDRDYVMEHTIFQILVDFIEKEKPWEFEATNKDMLEAYTVNEIVNDWEEIKYLYFWWKHVYPSNEAEITNLLMSKGVHNKYEKVKELERRNREELTNNMKRLVDLRGYLWT